MTAPSVPCWSCGGAVEADGLFCAACGTLQPPAPSSLFARMGVQPQFEVDGALLERRYFDRQRKLHPDRFTARPAKEREFSLQHSANLNEAYQTLRTPVRRAEYLLALHGRPMRGSREETVDDPEILLRALEMREELQDASTRAEAEVVEARARVEANECTRQLAAAFAVSDFDAAGRLTLRLKYLDKFAEDACEKRVRTA